MNNCLNFNLIEKTVRRTWVNESKASLSISMPLKTDPHGIKQRWVKTLIASMNFWTSRRGKVLYMLNNERSSA